MRLFALERAGERWNGEVEFKEVVCFLLRKFLLEQNEREKISTVELKSTHIFGTIIVEKHGNGESYLRSSFFYSSSSSLLQPSFFVNQFRLVFFVLCQPLTFTKLNSRRCHRRLAYKTAWQIILTLARNSTIFLYMKLKPTNYFILK